MHTKVTAVDSNGNETHGAEYAEKLLRLYPIRRHPLPNYKRGCQQDPWFRFNQDHAGGKLVTVLSCCLDDGTQKGHWLFAECGTPATARDVRKRWIGLTP